MEEDGIEETEVVQGVLPQAVDATELARDIGNSLRAAENNMFSGSTAAVASLKLDKAPPAKVIKEIGANESIIQVAIK